MQIVMNKGCKWPAMNFHMFLMIMVFTWDITRDILRNDQFDRDSYGRRDLLNACPKLGLNAQEVGLDFFSASRTKLSPTLQL